MASAPTEAHRNSNSKGRLRSSDQSLPELVRPCNPDLERLVIGSCLNNEAAFPLVSGSLPAAAFSLEKHRTLFLICSSLAGRGVPINVSTVGNELSNSHQLRSIGGISYLAELIEVPLTIAYLKSLVRILAEKHTRWLATMSSATLLSRFTGHEELNQLLADAQRQFEEIATSNRSTTFRVEDLPSVQGLYYDGIPFVVERLIQEGAVTMFTGEAASGKSTLMSTVAAQVAAGGEFAGRACREMPVLYLDRENPLATVQERFKRLHIPDLPNLKYWGGWNEEPVPNPWDHAVLDWLERNGPGLLCVDTVSSFIVGDENSTTDMLALLNPLRRLTDRGATVMMLHHTGKGEGAKDFRGASVFRDKIDAGLHLTNFGEGCLDRLRLRVWKGRAGIDGNFILTYKDGVFETDERPNAVSATVTEQLAELLKANPGVTSDEFEKLALAHKLPRIRARSFLLNGIAARTIDREKGPSNSKLHRWLGKEGANVSFL